MTDLLPTFRFFVTLDAADAYLPARQARLLPKIAAGAFQSATGLGADLEVMAYPEGGTQRIRAPAAGAPQLEPDHAQTGLRARSDPVAVVPGRSSPSRWARAATAPSCCWITPARASWPGNFAAASRRNGWGPI